MNKGEITNILIDVILCRKLDVEDGLHYCRYCLSASNDKNATMDTISHRCECEYELAREIKDIVTTPIDDCDPCGKHEIDAICIEDVYFPIPKVTIEKGTIVEYRISWNGKHVIFVDDKLCEFDCAESFFNSFSDIYTDGEIIVRRI